jgi:hypothetical protein
VSISSVFLSSVWNVFSTSFLWLTLSDPTSSQASKHQGSLSCENCALFLCGK